jgi:hypothetical protein
MTEPVFLKGRLVSKSGDAAVIAVTGLVKDPGRR